MKKVYVCSTIYDFPIDGVEIARSTKKEKQGKQESKRATIIQSTQTTVSPNHHKALRL